MRWKGMPLPLRELEPSSDELAPDASPLRRVGVVLPPANPSVEPELGALLGACVTFARLPVLPGDLRARLAAYPAHFESSCAAFGGVSIDAFILAVTGASYALGERGDRDQCAALAGKLSRPVTTASLAVVDALRALRCTSITLVSPYPDWLTRLSVNYWQSAGFVVARIESLSETFRAYEMQPREVSAALAAMCDHGGDAVVIAGTGLATLDSITQLRERFSAPLLSSNLCSAWWALHALALPPPSNNALARVCPRLAALS